MKLRIKKLVIAAVSVIAIVVVLLIVFLVRSPVLIITDIAFVAVYGESRIRQETIKSSFALFRQIRTVPIADDASDDIVRIAVTDVSSRPFCVLFPLRFARSARIYREHNPGIPVVILEGRYGEGTALSVIDGNENDYFVYGTDIDDEFFRAGMAAAALDMNKNGKTAVFLEYYFQTQARESFLRALNQLEMPPEARFFNYFSQYIEIPDLSSVVLAGAGAEYLELENIVPVIFLTWINPSLLPSEVVLVINDSPWAQAAQAVRMVSAGVKNGRIKSKFQFLKGITLDRKAKRRILK